MITNDQLLKLFVLVPSSVENFNGATVSGAANEHRIFFEQSTGLLWAKGQSFGGNDSELEAIVNGLIGEDTNKSIRTIAGEVLSEAMNLADDVDTTINNLTEVLNWFKDLPEEEEGALNLIAKIGKPAELYTAEDETENPEHVKGTVKTAATGLYKLIEDSVAAKNVTADGASGELLVDATASNNKVEVSSTTKLQNAVAAAETSIQSITVAGTALTVSGNANAKGAEITKSDLQSALFTNTYQSSPLTYSYLGVKVDIKESNGELTYLNIDPSLLLDTVYSYIASNELVTATALTNLNTRVTTLEEFNPWETYEASVTPSPEP